MATCAVLASHPSGERQEEIMEMMKDSGSIHALVLPNSALVFRYGKNTLAAPLVSTSPITVSAVHMMTDKESEYIGTHLALIKDAFADAMQSYSDAHVVCSRFLDQDKGIERFVYLVTVTGTHGKEIAENTLVDELVSDRQYKATTENLRKKAMEIMTHLLMKTGMGFVHDLSSTDSQVVAEAQSLAIANVAGCGTISHKAWHLGESTAQTDHHFPITVGEETTPSYLLKMATATCAALNKSEAPGMPMHLPKEDAGMFLKEGDTLVPDEKALREAIQTATRSNNTKMPFLLRLFTVTERKPSNT
jgi:hypothetical protein